MGEVPLYVIFDRLVSRLVLNEWLKQLLCGQAVDVRPLNSGTQTQAVGCGPWCI